MHDVEIERRDWSSAEERRNTTDDDELDAILGQRRECRTKAT